MTADPDAVDVLQAARAMTRALSPAGRVELEEALAGELHPAATAAERRLAELGALATLLNRAATARGSAPGPGRGSWHPDATPDSDLVALARRAPALAQGEYDRLRPAGAPSASRLSRRYGGWERACDAAFGLQADGTYLGHSRPWAPASSGRGSKPSRYTHEECLEGIRACARALGRRPTLTVYRAWISDKARAARMAGKPRPRLADYKTLRRLFGGWPAALAAAAITPADLTQTTPRWITTSASAPATRDHHDPAPAAEGPLFLDGAHVRERRAASGVSETTLLDALDLSRSAWRRMLNASLPIGSATLDTLAAVLATTPGALRCDTRRGRSDGRSGR